MFGRKKVAGYKWIKPIGVDFWEARVLDRDGNEVMIIVSQDLRLGERTPWMWGTVEAMFDLEGPKVGGFAAPEEAMRDAVEWVSAKKPTLEEIRREDERNVKKLELEARQQWRGSVGKGPLVYAESHEQLIQLLKKHYSKSEPSKFKIQHRSTSGWMSAPEP